MNTKKWVIWNAGFSAEPSTKKDFDIPPGAIIEATGKQTVISTSGKETLWSEVIYRDQTGWVYDPYLEDYVEKYPPDEVHIPHPTPDPFDAAQYMIVDEGVKRNMCGELCAAFISGDDIETFLDKWKEKSPSYYSWALGGDSDHLTDLATLNSMLSAYGYLTPCLRFDDGLRDQVIGFKISPGRLQKMLDRNYLIAGVKIDLAIGRLRGEGVSHWVVVDKVTPNGVNQGWVELYNPFPNRREEYSYDEFIHSAGPSSWLGLWVPRNTAA